MNITEQEKLSVSRNDVRRLLESGQHQYWQQLNNGLIEQVVNQFELWPEVATREPEPGRSTDGRMAEHMVRFLRYDIKQTRKILERLKHRNADYSQRYSKAVSDDEKNRLILDYARDLGASDKQLRGDKKAFNRWFGHDAVSDRYQRRFLETERYLSFVLQSLGRIAALTITEDGETVGYQQFWERLALEPVIKPLLRYQGDKRVVSAAFHSLTEALDTMPVELQHECLTESSQRFIYHSCLSTRQSVWIQCEALRLLRSASPNFLAIVLRRRLRHPLANDDLFVRRTAVDIIGQQLPSNQRLAALIRLVVKDPSPSVRQKLPAALNQANIALIEKFYPALLLDDPVEQVRASALLNLTALMSREDCLALALQYLCSSLRTEQQPFVLRVALKVCRDSLEESVNKHVYLQTIMPAVEHLHQQADSLSVRRWAAQTREYLLCFGNETTAQQIKSLQQFVNTIAPGKTRRIPKQLQLEDNNQLGRLLSVIAQQDYGFDVETGLFGSFITRGHAFGFRLWRVLHEFRHPSPDKRQAFQHTRGRLFWGTMRVPSAILSELSETKVPGEPLYLETEQGWRGYLPLVDEVISAMAVGNQPTWFYHSEGITRLQPPNNFLRRWLTSWHISYYFADYARLRNWLENSQDSPQSYFQALEKLGIQLVFQGHGSDFGEVSEDAAVLRFFPLALPLGDIQHWQEFKDYFVSVYENTLYELSVFLGIAIAYFLGRHLYLYRQIKKARNNIPLVLGGWGTRGKSGTERIKAALMNALGYSIVSKTTGCEAMFLHAHPYGELREMFLFRPYDKATIWEQHNLVCLSEKLNTEVFLWECMGLTPSYIDILQRQWMRDDISTITNTYPDHEDLQGPAGVNIPEVMTQFIPERSTLITSEEQMLPILQSAAQQKEARFRSVGWLEAGLLADDVLERFPYDEHPFNIALVMAMGDELGVDGDFALKEMADRVVADIGVLKTFPCAPWRSRRLEFINGMSANERFGCLGNWQRMGLDKVSMQEQPDTWITIVVNNRADRIARSRVFASIITKDISFDRCVLIGNNLPGMVSYMKEAWAEWIESISLKSEDEDAKTILIRMAERFRVPYSKHLLELQFQAMVEGQQSDIDIAELLNLIDQPDQLEQKMLEHNISCHQEILQFLEQAQSLKSSYEDLLAKLQQSGTVTDNLQQAFHDLLWQWFEKKLVIVDDYYSTGNQVIETICDVTPPGFYNRILGMQNIKGTGLDFVYRWQAWENCHKACTQLLNTSASESAKGLSALAAFQEYGYLAKEMVVDTVEKVKVSALAQNERYQAELELIQANLEQSLSRLSSENKQEASSNTWLAKLNQGIESFLDTGDAVKRRKRADQIYKDLVDERISHDRAALELQAINKRQKGGWFSIFK
jgi:poly-gamma-glutamate synthase PgsB/CapB